MAIGITQSIQTKKVIEVFIDLQSLSEKLGLGLCTRMGSMIWQVPAMTTVAVYTLVEWMGRFRILFKGDGMS